jgi:sec-independent protein translocase protein TatA
MGLGLSNPTHILLIAVVLLLVFGAKRLPEMGRSLGVGLREFKHSINGSSESDTTQSLTASGPAIGDEHVAKRSDEVGAETGARQEAA